MRKRKSLNKRDIIKTEREIAQKYLLWTLLIFFFFCNYANEKKKINIKTSTLKL